MSSTSAEILEAKIDRMGRELRASDLVSGVLRTLLGVLSILFLAVLAEQCLTQHGLGPITRWLVSLLVYGVGGTLLVVQVLRVIRHRINPVYAAALIEDAEPGLKNSLISWVYLRRRHGRDPISSRVFESLESHTAETLTTTENSVVVDRHHLIQLGVALGVLLTLLCVYIVVSPKNPIVTFARILLPWADIDAPTRVQISEVRPGDAVCTMGETLVISATVRGLREDEEPQVQLDTMDGRIQGQLVPMRRDEKTAFGYTATVPPGSEGTQQGFVYAVIAGDAQSSRFDVKMQIPMLAEVTAVTYDYPAFTGQSTQRMVGSGNIHAPESTKLEIEVHANRPLAKATLIPDGLSVTPIPLAISKENTQNAKGTWILETDPEHPERPRYAAYRLQVQDTSGNHNANPPSYRVTMIPNRLPKIEWTDPPEEGASVPMNQELTLSLTANDPDYGLKDVTITFEKDGKVFAEEALWQDTQDETDVSAVHEKTVATSFSFRGDRATWKLRPGDHIAYRASCRDLRGVPLAQPAQTETRSFILGSPNRNAAKKPEEKKTVKNPTNSTVTAEDQPTGDTDTTGDADNIDTTKSSDNTSTTNTSDTAQPPANDTAPDTSTNGSSEKPSKDTSDSTSQDSADASETTESAESTSDASPNSQEESSSEDSNSTNASERSLTEPSPSEGNTQKNKDAQKNASEQKNHSGENNSSKGDGNSGKNDNAAQNNKSKQQNDAENKGANGEDQTAGSSASASSDSSRKNGENTLNSKSGKNSENGKNKNGNRSETSNTSDSQKQERVDSQTSPGDAMERILEYARQQSDKQSEKPANSPSDTQSRQPSEQTNPQSEKQPSDSAQNPSDATSPSDSQSSENSQKNSGNKKDGKSGDNKENDGNDGNKKNDKNSQTENSPSNEPSVENSSEESGRTPEKASSNSSDSQNSNSQNPGSQSGSSSSDSSQPGSPSDSSQPAASQGDTPQSGTPSGNDSTNASGQNSSSDNPSQNTNSSPNADSPQNNASGNHPSDGNQASDAAGTEKSPSSERETPNATTDGKSSESSPEKTDSDAISDSDSPGDPRTARAAAKGTDPKDAARSDDPALRRAAQEAVQQGAETLHSTESSLQPRDETLSTNRPYGGDQTDPTTSDTPVRPGDPFAQQALHPETPNRQAIQHSPDAISGDGRESGGTRPTERPQPVNAAGNDFRNATPDGTGRTGTQADENGTQSLTTNQQSATTSESPNGRPGQSTQTSDSQTNTQKQPFSNAHATEDAQNTQNDPDPLGKMGQSDNMHGKSGGELSGSSRKSNPSSEEPANAPRGDSRESGAGYQNPESMNPAEDGSRETGADLARTDFTRQNTQLALQTLEEALKKQDTALLDQLGWSRAEAEAFLRQWKQIAAVAGGSTQEGEDAKKSLKSLGLSAQNATTRRTVPGQKTRQLRQTSTIEAPAEWNEWFQAYRRSVGQTTSKPNPTP